MIYDCFTDARGRRFIAGEQVSEAVWRRVAELVGWDADEAELERA